MSHVLYQVSFFFVVMSGGVSSRFSSFLPQSKDMYVRLIGVSKLPVGVIVSVHGCSSAYGAAIDWRPVQVDPCLSPEESWDRLQQILVTLNWTKRVWMMDGWMSGGSVITQQLCVSCV